MDRYVAILYVKPPTPQILEFRGGFWILDFGDFGFWGFWILGILDFGDFGFWILRAKIQNPPIQNPKTKKVWFLDFGLDRYVANVYVVQISGILGILDFGFWIWGLLDFGFGDFGFWILDLGDFGFWGFWILDCGDFGSWILDRYVANLYVRPPTPQIWGFGILDFGGFGDFGFWILRFGGWKSLGAKFVTNFGFYIRVRRLCTPPRVGGLFCWQGQHEETFFKSILPYFEWDGFGLGARFCAFCATRFHPSASLRKKKNRTEEKRGKIPTFTIFPTFPHPSLKICFPS